MIFITYPLIWTQAVVDKIWQKHRVTPEEVEEAIYDDRPICHKATSNSYCVYGQTVSGRYLFIVLGRKGRGARFKVVTARDMQHKEKPILQEAPELVEAEAGTERRRKGEHRGRIHTSI